MNKKTILNILSQNIDSYNAIAKVFSKSREKLWGEFYGVKPFLFEHMSILDAGCGSGRAVDLVKDMKNIFYKGIDQSEALIQEAKKREEHGQERNIHFEVGNLLSLKEQENKYDLIFCFASLHHIPSHDLCLQILKDFFQILSPGGILFMTNWNLWNISRKKSVWRYQHITLKNILTFWGPPEKSYPLCYHAFTRNELSRLLQKAGFQKIQNNYTKNGEPVSWYNGNNILTIAKK